MGESKTVDPVKQATDAAAEAAKDSPAAQQGNAGDPDPRKETPPVADKDTPKRPAAAANAEDVLGPSDSGPNAMSTAGLTITQRARVEGTPVTGNLNFPGEEGANEAVRYGGKYTKDGKVTAAWKKEHGIKDED